MLSYIFNKLKYSVFFGLLFAATIYIFSGANGIKKYTLGIITGGINFILMVIGFDLILRLSSRLSGYFGGLYFILRYSLIVFVITRGSFRNSFGLFTFAGGFLTVYLSVITSSYTKKYKIKGD